ncbi:MAG TPA: anti-sigma factor [Dehalococcoidia bacterium]|jgi:anti-sigma-K factor RskA
MSCEEIDELAGAYAFGALPDAQRAAVAAHLASCERHPEMRELEALAASLALAAEEMEPPPALESRLMEAIQADRRASQSATCILISVQGSLFDTIRGWFASPPLGYGLSAALAVAVVGLLAWNISLQGGSADQVVVNVSGSASGRVIYLKDEGLAVMDVRGLPALPSGKVYEVWSMSSGKATRLGLLNTTASGEASASMPFNDSGVNLVAVTVEQAPGVDQPTTSPVFSAAFS